MVALILFLDYIDLYTTEDDHELYLTGCLFFAGNRQNQHNLLK